MKLQVPSDFGFLQTFDMFFKCHKVFNLKYNPSIAKLMHFIDHFMFGAKENEEDVTVTMKKVAEKLNISA